MDVVEVLIFVDARSLNAGTGRSAERGCESALYREDGDGATGMGGPLLTHYRDEGSRRRPFITRSAQHAE